MAFELTPASASEQTTLRAMIRATFAETPDLAARCRDFSADRGLDSAETKALLWDDYSIRPLIDTRALWRDEKRDPGYAPTKPITRPLDPARADTIVHTEKGTLHCVCPLTGGVTRPRLPGLRGRAQHPQVSLPGRRLRPGVPRQGRMPPGRRGESRGVWAQRAHQA